LRCPATACFLEPIAMIVPITNAERLKCIALETAKMSYPGSMSRAKEKPVVAKGTKKELQTYFASTFPLQEAWTPTKTLISGYDKWHKSRVDEIVGALHGQIRSGNNPEAVAAKFLNTFMYQLMKYEACRALLPALHLPLDSRVFSALKIKKNFPPSEFPSLVPIREKLKSSPYLLKYDDYLVVQKAMSKLMKDLNKRPNVQFSIENRIELNWLWL
jgi:hypothetical protein